MATLSQVVMVIAVLASLTALVLVIAWALNRIFFALIFGGDVSGRAPMDSVDALALLLNPDFAAFQAHYGLPAPDELRAFYSDIEFVSRTEFHISFADGQRTYYIRRFLPVSTGTFDLSARSVGARHFAFAEDDFGNYYIVDLSQAEGETHAVLFVDHDGSDTEVVTDSLAAFRRGSIGE